nr:AAA-type ATPase family protein [Tanacetum cinerariifolium]
MHANEACFDHVCVRLVNIFFLVVNYLDIDYLIKPEINNDTPKVVFKERKNCSLVLFVKGVEKSMMLNTEVHASSKSKIESLPGNVVVIASHSYGQ